MINLPIGTIIDEKFHISGTLGKGGLGTVFRAEQPALNRTVAIKVLHHALADTDENRLRFEREARILATINDEHVVHVFAFGVLPGGYPYMVMEYLEGEPLSQVLAGEGRLDWRRVCRIGIQICKGLSAAHKLAVVHRDLKPQNIMVLQKPEPDTVKILDFGLSKIISGADMSNQKLTQTGAIVGSIHYMSPEMCSGQALDLRSDVYSVGCVLYECLCARPVFESDNPVFLLHKHQTEMPAPFPCDPSRDAIPDPLQQVVFKCLQKNRDDRYQTIEELADALSLAIENRFSEITVSGVQMGGAVHPGRSIAITLLLIVSFFVAASGLCVFLAKSVLDDQRRAQSMSVIMGEVQDEILTPQARRTLGRRLKSSKKEQEIDQRCRSYLDSINSLPPRERTPAAGIEAGAYAEATLRLADKECNTRGVEAAVAMVEECLSWVQKYKPGATVELCNLLEWKADYLFWLKKAPEAEKMYATIGAESFRSNDLEESRKRRYRFVSGIGLARFATVRKEYGRAYELIEKVYQGCDASPRMQGSALVELIGVDVGRKDKKGQQRSFNEILSVLREGWLWREPRPFVYPEYCLWMADIFAGYGDRRLAAEFLRKGIAHCRDQKRKQKLILALQKMFSDGKLPTPETASGINDLNLSRSALKGGKPAVALEAINRYIELSDRLILDWGTFGEACLLKAEILEAQGKTAGARDWGGKARQAFWYALITADDSPEWEAGYRRLGDVESRYMGIPFQMKRSKKLPNRLMDGWLENL